jgi:hypothetical protein
MMAQERKRNLSKARKQGISAKVSAHFARAPDLSDADLARMIASAWGLRHDEVIIKADDDAEVDKCG